ncbi:MAG: hypothetical protein E7470_03000 [Ruminococcaceae bacterium]|nr:hypothetical protein [Oscillospiraceae bacterium]
MKRLFCILLSILALFSLTGCRNDSDVSQSMVTVYYKSARTSFGTQDGVIAPYSLDAAGHEEDHAYLINTYVSAKTPGDYATTFPTGTRLVRMDLDGLTAKIVLCDEFATLKGLDLTIACACLSRTVIALTGCHEVIISAESMQLDGKNFITLSRDSYLLLDTEVSES